MTTAPMNDTTSTVQVYTRAVTSHEPLVSLLPHAYDVLSWIRHGSGLIGWGEAARFTCHGPQRFAEMQVWWQEFTQSAMVENPVGLPGTGLVTFVSMAFADEPAESVLIVPRVIMGRHNGIAWVTEISPDSNDIPALTTPVRSPGLVRYAEGQLSVTAYRHAVRSAVNRMRKGTIGKVVLAHDLLAMSEYPYDPRFLLQSLTQRYPECWSFAVDGLVGATPELLLRRQGTEVSSQVLAGTIWSRPNTSSDELAAELLASAKNQHEHDYAVQSLLKNLAPLCKSIISSPTPEVLQLSNVTHLATMVRGQLAADYPLLKLAAAVHPTAAVGGTPTDLALQLITELEGMDRGRYAGPVGWLDSNGNGELGIALRCAQISGNTARLFAGCGIVAESDPDTEVAEAGTKMIPIRDALEGN